MKKKTRKKERKTERNSKKKKKKKKREGSISGVWQRQQPCPPGEDPLHGWTELC